MTKARILVSHVSESRRGAPIFVLKVDWGLWRREVSCYPTRAKLGWGTHFRADSGLGRGVRARTPARQPAGTPALQGDKERVLEKVRGVRSHPKTPRCAWSFRMGHPCKWWDDEGKDRGIPCLKI